MITWIGKPEQRIISWRHFKLQIVELSLEQAINKTLEVWSTSPRINKFGVDASNFLSWPGPWELLSRDTFCNLAQNLGVFYTLKLAHHPNINSIYFNIGHTDLCDIYHTEVNGKNIRSLYSNCVNTKPSQITQLDYNIQQHRFTEI